ncbi:MAG: SPFH domain-containing protein [Eggerthellaceae bacterium]|nr:SPFH domain-containing protein [Eggerthellaceae bacterium]
MGTILGLIFIVAVALVVFGAFYIVKQQEAFIIERLGKFNRITGPGFHFMIPFLDRIAAKVSLRTMKNEFTIDAKTKDNVTIGLDISAQYHVNLSPVSTPEESGVYRSHYILLAPYEQMRDFISDALRSAIPQYSLDEVFEKKEEIANDVNSRVSALMAEYGFVITSTLITRIALPKNVEDSMNEINAAQRTRAAAQDFAEADRIKTVTEARAHAESMEEAGKGIAAQRKAIAEGIRDSLDVIAESGVTPEQANELFMFTQWADMMSRFAETGNASTVVLPNNFNESASMFEQMLAANKSTGNNETQ